MRFCCSDFEGDYSVGNTFGTNIRIVKITSDFIVNQAYKKSKQSRKEKNWILRYFITLGYEKFKLDLPLKKINFCPYCGTNLQKFYNKDEYANEIEGETFKL